MGHQIGIAYTQKDELELVGALTKNFDLWSVRGLFKNGGADNVAITLGKYLGMFFIFTFHFCFSQSNPPKKIANLLEEKRALNPKDSILLHKLISSQEFTVVKQSNGCFHSIKETWTISGKSKIRTLTLFETRVEHKPKKIYKTELISEDLQAIENIFRAGLKLGWGGCTTHDAYTIKTNTDSLKFDDSTCGLKLYSEWETEVDRRKRL